MDMEQFKNDYKSQPQSMKDLCWIYACLFITRDDNIADLVHNTEIQDTLDTLNTYLPYGDLILLWMLVEFFDFKVEGFDMTQADKAIKEFENYQGLWGRDIMEKDTCAYEEAIADMI